MLSGAQRQELRAQCVYSCSENMEEQNANSVSSNSGYSNSNHNNNNALGVNRSSSKIAKGSIKRSGSGSGGGVIQSAAAIKQKQTPVFKIDKSDFRIAVQRLTGTPPVSDNRNGSSPPPPLSSRLHKIRPPPLSFATSGDGGLALPRLPQLSLLSPAPSAFGRTLPDFDGNAMASAAMQLPSPSFFSQLPPLTPGDHVWANTPDAVGSQRPEIFPPPWSVNWGDPIPSYNRILPVPSPAHQFTIPSPLPSPGGLGVPLSPNGLFSPLPALFPSPTAFFPMGAQTIRGSLHDSPTGGLATGFSFSHGHM